MRSSLVKFVRSPLILASLILDLLWVPLWIRLIGVRAGRRCRFVGLPIVKIVPGAQIKLGDDVLVNSRSESNSAGLPHPSILAALSPHSSIVIGDGTGLSGASISARCNITIGKKVLIGAGACIWDNDFHPLDAKQRREHPTDNPLGSPINIEDDVFIGARALILKGVRIGRGAVVGAGSVVTRDVKAEDIVAGNPARVVRSINPHE
jgi:acetyltransferase-like isoleucine patch superfamily enzyme